MSQYWGRGKGLFEGFEGFSAFWSEVPSNPLSSQMRERNCNIGVVKNESSIKISESEKGRNVLDFVWFRPLRDQPEIACSQGTPWSWCGSHIYWCRHIGDFCRDIGRPHRHFCGVVPCCLSR